jgi:hypothetical protein
VANRIAHIRLNRPEVRNVQSTILLEELDHAIDRAGADHEVRVIVLSGEGTQGFTGYIQSATHVARRINWADPGFALPKPRDSGVKRLPMVQVALERYERERAKKGLRARPSSVHAAPASAGARACRVSRYHPACFKQ